MKTVVALAFASLLIVPAAEAKDLRAKPLLLGLQTENRDLQALAPGETAPSPFGPSFRGSAGCGPDREETIVGPGGALIGYACVAASANGS